MVALVVLNLVMLAGSVRYVEYVEKIKQKKYHMKSNPRVNRNWAIFQHIIIDNKTPTEGKKLQLEKSFPTVRERKINDKLATTMQLYYQRLQLILLHCP